MRKIPLRTCLVTREKVSKYELIRVVKDKDNNVFVDESGKLNGHGVYLKKEVEVINKAKDKKILDKALEITIPDNIYDELLKIVRGDSNE